VKKTEQAPKRYSEDEVAEIVRKAIRQEREFLAQMLRGMPDLDAETKQRCIENPSVFSEVLSQGLSAMPLDTIVRVARSVRPTYPDWVDKVMNPELEGSGPTKYDLAKQISLSFFDDLKVVGVTKGDIIYGYLKEHDILKTCLSLRDGEEILKKNVTVFRKIFGRRGVFLWKSAVWQDGVGNGLYVPYLYEFKSEIVNEVKLSWHWDGNIFDGRDPVIRFNK
jgi:hypothetical protein